jgi:hypothetical protein
MKTLNAYKAAYRRATQKGEQKIMNEAVLNLSAEDSRKFISWQQDRQAQGVEEDHNQHVNNSYFNK